MSTGTKLWIGAAALTLAAGSVAIPTGARAETCAPGAAAVTFTDPADDATKVIEDTFVYSDPALDILEAGVAWDDVAQTTTFTISVADLSDLPPLGSLGTYFDFNFAAGGRSFYLSASWFQAEGVQEFELGRYETTRTKLADVAGSFDVATDTVTLVVPALVTGTDGQTAFQLQEGNLLEGFEVVSRRILGHSGVGSVIPDADDAQGSCPVTVTGVAPVNGGGFPVLDQVGEAATLDGSVVAGAYGVCAPDSCARLVFAVNAPSGTSLTVSFAEVQTAEGPDAITDLDLRLRGPGSMHILTDEPGTGDTITVVDPPAGTYELEVVAFTAVQTDFSATAVLA